MSLDVAPFPNFSRIPGPWLRSRILRAAVARGAIVSSRSAEKMQRVGGAEGERVGKIGLVFRIFGGILDDVPQNNVPFERLWHRRNQGGAEVLRIVRRFDGVILVWLAFYVAG